MHKSIDFIQENRKKKNSNNKKRVVFLDIDGVLQPYSNQYRFDHNMQETIDYLCKKYNDEIYREIDIYDVCAAFYDWDDVAIGILTKILRVTNSYIVVHSGWKEYNNIKQLKALFRLYNLDDYVIDVCDKGDKIRVVNKYLEEHTNEIEEYIVIDDEDMTFSFGYRFIRTYNFLNSKNYEHCVKVLKGLYRFELKGKEFSVFKNNDKVVNISFRNVSIKEKNVVYLQFYNYVNHINDIDYFIVANYLIKYFNDLNNENVGICVFGCVQNKMFEYIKTWYSFKEQYTENDYLFYYPLNNKRYENVRFYQENYGLMIEEISNIKW